jgi:hypothetical protein
VTTKNRWQSFDTIDPVLVWTLAVPAPQAADRRSVVDELLEAGRSSGVLLAGDGAVGVGDAELLPWELALVDGGQAPWSSRVFVRDALGALVQRTASDAGALLRSLEPLEPAYARRFAASRPFAAAWSTSTASTVTVQVGFYTSLWFDDADVELAQRNEPALTSFRAAMAAIARRRGGRLVAPLSPPATTGPRGG